jgi:L-threonylcarbamoyladenylate synthase
MEPKSNPSENEIKDAATALMMGKLVAFPTETVYGLGADATNERAINRIFSVKNRPPTHPLIVHISSMNYLDKWAINIPGYAMKLAREFWPGPMTLILKRSNLAKNFITGGQDCVGIRVPANHMALKLLHHFEQLGGEGVAAPSANRFGAVSPTTAESVSHALKSYLAVDDLILDGGHSEIGIESTIIECLNESPNILRPGFISKEMVEGICNVRNLKLDESSVRAPGLMLSHYAPLAEVVLDTSTSTGDGFLAMSEIETPSGAIRLGSPSTIEQYAKILYSALRMADKKKLNRIVVIQPLGSGLALAIRDRLSKAAAR